MTAEGGAMAPGGGAMTDEGGAMAPGGGAMTDEGGAMTAALSAEHLAGAALGWVGVQGTKVLKSLDWSLRVESSSSSQAQA